MERGNDGRRLMLLVPYFFAVSVKVVSFMGEIDLEPSPDCGGGGGGGAIFNVGLIPNFRRQFLLFRVKGRMFELLISQSGASVALMIILTTKPP